MKYIQSFYQYPVTFSSIGKTMPSREAVGEMRNLAEITDEELEKLQNCEPFFRSLVNKKKYRVLNHMPDSYRPASEMLNEARTEADKLREENEKLRAQLGGESADETEPADTQNLNSMDYKQLQETAKELGLEYKNVKKSDLIKMIEEARA